jgi:hypothetical protein
MFEAQPSCLSRRRVIREDASEVGMERSGMSRSKSERILLIKMEAKTTARARGAQKEIMCRDCVGGKQKYSETILLLFARAGSTKYISFFCLIIGFKGY